MSYKKLTLVDKETIIDKKLLDHIQDGIISTGYDFSTTEVDSTLFELGTWGYTSGTFSGHNKRIRHKETLKAETDIYIGYIDSLYRLDVCYYEDNITDVYYDRDDVRVKNLIYKIPSGSYYRIGVRKLDENDVVTADISTFASKFGVLSPLSAKIYGTECNLNPLLPPKVFPESAQEMAEVLLDCNNKNISDADFRLAVFADPHSDEIDKYKKFDLLNDTGLIDVILGLGDFHNYSVEPKSIHKRTTAKCLNASGRKPNCLYTNGNHETGMIQYVNSGILSEEFNWTKKETYDILQRHLNNIAVVDKDNPYGCYYYIDYPAQKIRFIMLNSSDIWSMNDTLDVKYRESVMYQPQQITWFANTALDFSEKGGDASNWSVICAMHAPYAKAMITEILNSVKQGISLNKSWTFKQRLVYNESTGQWSGSDTTVGDTYTVNKDYSQQGPVHVIGMFYGHLHGDATEIINTIPVVGFIGDNGVQQDFYYLNVEGVIKGSYTFTMEKTGEKWTATIAQDFPEATRIGYSNYNPNSCGLFVADDDWNIIKSYSGTKTTSVVGTELTGFKSDRKEGTINTESAAIVCINKDTKTITTIPYGIAARRIIQYEE